MLHIIGVILKCIGILIAVILGLIVFVLSTVLFVPIRFEAKAVFPGKKEEILASAKVTWLWHLIRADVTWQEQKLEWKVRAAWKIFDGKEEDVKTEVEEEVAEKTEVTTLKAEPEKEKKLKKVEMLEGTKLLAAKETSREGKENAQKKESFWEKVKKKIQGFIERIKYTFRKICDKIKEGAALKDKVTAFLTDEVHKAALMRVKKEFIWLKRFFKITKGNINLRFGFEDPAVTGYALAGLSVLYALLEGNVYVEPDFEEKCLEGSVYLKGRLRLIHPTILAIKVILDKNVRQTYKDIKAFKSS